MFEWYWLIVAFLIGGAFEAIAENWTDHANVFTVVFAAIAIPFAWVVMFPIVFFKHTFHPTSREHFEKFLQATNGTASSHYHISKNLVLWHDPKAREIQSRWFLVRIKDGGAENA